MSTLDTGYKNPATTVTVSSTYKVWANPNNVKSSDNQKARADLGRSGDSSYSQLLRCTGFALNLPSNASILGVIVAVECNQSGTVNMVKDHTIRLRKTGGTVSENRAKDEWWTQNEKTITHGGTSDKWGFQTLTVADVNNADFGVDIQVKNHSTIYNPSAYIDHVKLIVYYTTGTPPAPPGSQLVAGKDFYGRGLGLAYHNRGFKFIEDDIKAILCTSEYIPNKNEHQSLEDITNEVTGGGYTTGGVSLPVSGRYVDYNPDTEELIFYSADLEFSNITLTFRTIVFYLNKGSTDAEKPLLYFITYDTDQTKNNSTWVLNLQNGLLGLDLSKN